MSDPRITRLEEALAHHEAVVEDLHQIVRRQQEEIDRLTRRVTMLMQRAAEQEAEATSGIPLADQKPPHW